MKGLVAKYGYLVALFALAISTYAAEAPCAWLYHQPKLPDSVKKLRRF